MAELINVVGVVYSLKIAIIAIAIKLISIYSTFHLILYMTFYHH